MTKSVEEGLNDRQQTCLRIVYKLDRAGKRRYAAEGAEQWSPPAVPGWSPPENAWRWLQYDPSHLQPNPPLKQELTAVGLEGRGIKRTFDALWARGYVLLRRQHLGRYRVMMVKLTAAGRRAARALDQTQG